MLSQIALSLEVGATEQGRSTTENHRMSPQEKEKFRQRTTIDSTVLPASVQIYTYVAGMN